MSAIPMRSIWYSLAWKEWHEHKWKLLSISSILAAVTIAVLADNEPIVFESILVALIYGIAPLAMFMGATEAAGEQSRGTNCFIQSLPVPMWMVASCKLM